MAEGVLVLGVGSGTKVMGTFLTGSKGYYAVGKLGTRTGSISDLSVTLSLVTNSLHRYS
jgi:tRNA U55 pseudouridine synthase TruB